MLAPITSLRRPSIFRVDSRRWYGHGAAVEHREDPVATMVRQPSTTSIVPFLSNGAQTCALIGVAGIGMTSIGCRRSFFYSVLQIGVSLSRRSVLRLVRVLSVNSAT